MSGNYKNTLKSLINELVNEILSEEERETVSRTQEILINPPNTFEKYLKDPGNIGLSFTPEEKTAAQIINPFKVRDFEIRYRSEDEIANSGKFEKINKLTVLKKIQAADIIVYKTFTLIEPSQKPQEKEADPKKPKKPEPIKVIIKSSDSFSFKLKQDPKLLTNFLQKVNTEMGL